MQQSAGHTLGRFKIIPFLMCLEAILGVTTACLPVLKPVFSKFRKSINKLSGRKDTDKSLMFGSIPIVMRVSQMWQSRSRKRTGREKLDSMASIEDCRRLQTKFKSTPKAERLVGMKLSEIHVQRNIHVESAFDEDRISALE